MDNLRSLFALPRVRAIGERDGFLEDYAQVTGNLSVRGNLVPDAHLATVLRQHGIRTLYTNDADGADAAFSRLEAGARAGADRSLRGRALALRGMVAQTRGDIPRAAVEFVGEPESSVGFSIPLNGRSSRKLFASSW